jgi:hypothetical protein
MSSKFSWLQQACAELAPDRGPALPLPIVSNEATALSCRVEALLDVTLLELAGGDPSTQRPGRMIQRRISAAWRHHGDVVQDLAHVRLG